MSCVSGLVLGIYMDIIDVVSFIANSVPCDHKDRFYGNFTLCDGTSNIPRYHIQGAFAVGKWLKLARHL